MARRIVDEIMYMTLATADGEGRPWASPVWFASSACREYLWVSDPGARHSLNIAARQEVAITIFDSTAPIGGAEAVYVEAVATKLEGDQLQNGIARYSLRSTEVGAPEWSVADVSPPASRRLYRATATAVFVLGPHDRRIAVDFGGSS